MFAALLMIGVAAVAAAPVLLLGMAGSEPGGDDEPTEDPVPGGTGDLANANTGEPQEEPSSIQGLLDDVLTGQFDIYPEAPMSPVLQPVPGDVADVPADDPLDGPVLQPVVGDVPDTPGDPDFLGPVLSPVPGDFPENPLPAPITDSPVEPDQGDSPTPEVVVESFEASVPLRPSGDTPITPAEETAAGFDAGAETPLDPKPALASETPDQDDSEAGQPTGSVL